jgi:hypothetical protein
MSHPADDSKPVAAAVARLDVEYVGLWTELVSVLEGEMKLPTQHPCSSLVILKSLRTNSISLVLAATGSG